MSDFTDFLAAMAIEDAMEEDDNTSSSGRSYRNKSEEKEMKEPMTAGCWLMFVCDVLAVVCVILTDWLLIIPITVVLSFIVGFLIDIIRDLKRGKA